MIFGIECGVAIGPAIDTVGNEASGKRLVFGTA